MKLKWFGVKVLIRTDLVGRPRAPGRFFDPDATLVEEQVFIVRARDATEAARHARRLALSEKPRSRNVHGQRIRCRVLPSWVAYELFDPPRDGREVFSDTWRFSKRVTDAKIAALFLSRSLTRGEQMRRLQFMDGGIAKALVEWMAAPNPPLQRTISPRVRSTKVVMPTRRRARR